MQELADIKRKVIALQCRDDEVVVYTSDRATEAEYDLSIRHVQLGLLGSSPSCDTTSHYMDFFKATIKAIGIIMLGLLIVNILTLVLIMAGIL